MMDFLSIINTVFRVSSVAAVVIFVGCTNIRSLSRGGSSSDQSGTSSVASGSGNIVTISRTVKSNADPDGSIDIVGDGSDSIGEFCYAADGASAGSGDGESTCECHLEYTDSTEAAQSVDVVTTHFEANLIRCKYDSIPDDVTEVEVSIHVTPSDAYSNAVTFDLEGSDESLDLSDATSWAPVKRYQCRDIVTIWYMYEGFDSENLYDPIQSESLRYTYPLDFYTTNLGGALLALANESNTDPAFFSKWLCSTNPYTAEDWENLNLFSAGADSNGNKQIYPTSGSTDDRSTFYLAKESTGIFSVEVKAFIAPGILGDSAGDYEPLGYGASPVSTDEGEECPEDQVTIPDGFHWVKVWAFRGSLDPRSYVERTEEIYETGYVACNPGLYEETETDESAPLPVFQDCSPFGRDGTEATGDQYAYDMHKPLSSDLLPGDLANRIIGGGNVCVFYPDQDGDGAYLGEAGQGNALSGSSFPIGADAWGRVGGEYDTGADFTFDNSDDDQGDVPWNLSNVDEDDPDAGGHFYPKDADNDGVDDNGVVDDSDLSLVLDGPIAFPYDFEDNFVYGDLDGEVSRTDYVFVVSPPEVMRETMKNQDSGYEPYHPYRYKNEDDCDSPDPDASTTCIDNSEQKITYSIWSTDIDSNPDAAETEGDERDPVYPVCAIQPDADEEEE